MIHFFIRKTTSYNRFTRQRMLLLVLKMAYLSGLFELAGTTALLLPCKVKMVHRAEPLPKYYGMKNSLQSAAQFRSCKSMVLAAKCVLNILPTKIAIPEFGRSDNKK